MAVRWTAAIRRSCLIVGLIGGVLASRHAGAAEINAAMRADFQRAAAAVSLSTSDQPALRAEAQTRAPSAAFRLGAAYVAWTNAAAQLAFDVANPTAAGPPHASQNGALAAFLADDCREEAIAFTSLTAGLKALDAGASELAVLAGSDQTMLIARQATQPTACRPAS